MSEQDLIYQRYQITKHIGMGGMGEVFLSQDTHTDTQVALKQLKPELITHDASMVERFVREGEALRRLNHPNIVKVLDSFQEDDNHYIVMEYVSGGSLRDKLIETPQLDIETVLHIGLELADALSRAHHLKILHRDIKPANVLLTDDSTPHLTDFGIARLDDHSRVTETGAVMGTFAYMSPEACRSEPVNTSSDIWALGVMLYEMLTGIRPFDREQLPATINAILNDPPTPIQSIRPDIPDRLAQLIHQLLEKDPNQRISSARVVGVQIEAIIQDTDTAQGHFDSRFETPTPAEETATTSFMSDTPTSKMDTPHTQPQQKQNNNLRWIGAVAVILILIAIGLVASGVFNPPTAENTPTAVAQVAPSVESVAENEYMMLVAQLENTGGQERDATRFIIQDLQSRLEDVAYTRTHVRELNIVVTSDTQALELAEINGADVIVWGKYNDSAIVLEVQAGSLNKFPHNSFERDLIEKTTNISVQITDELTQSSASNVLSVLATLYLSDGDIYRWARTVVAINEFGQALANPVGNSVSRGVHNFYRLYLSDDATLSLNEMDSAIESDTNNPFLYAMRAIKSASIFSADISNASAITSANRDEETLWTLAQDWVTNKWIEHLTAWTDAQKNEALESIIEILPDDWFAYFLLSITYDAFDRNTQDYQYLILAHELNPNSSLTYPAIAIDAFVNADYFQLAKTIESIPFDYPTLENEISTVLQGQPDALSSLAMAYSTLHIGQLETVIRTMDNFSIQEGGPGGGLISGLAECRLGLDSAIASFQPAMATQIAQGSHFMLRGIIHRQLGNVEQAEKDFQRALNSELGNKLAPYVYGAQQGILTCENIFDPEAITAAEEAYASR